MATHSRVALQSVSETLACKHSERVRHKTRASAVFQPKFITEHSDLQSWHGYRSGQKASATTAAAGRTCLKRSLGRASWAGAGARPGQAKGTGFRQV